MVAATVWAPLRFICRIGLRLGTKSCYKHDRELLLVQYNAAHGRLLFGWIHTSRNFSENVKTRWKQEATMLVASEAVDRQTPYNLTGGLVQSFFRASSSSHSDHQIFLVNYMLRELNCSRRASQLGNSKFS